MVVVASFLLPQFIEFVVCETERFSRLAELPSSCFEVVRQEEVLEGFRVAIIQEWALSRARRVSWLASLAVKDRRDVVN